MDSPCYLQSFEAKLDTLWSTLKSGIVRARRRARGVRLMSSSISPSDFPWSITILYQVVGIDRLRHVNCDKMCLSGNFVRRRRRRRTVILKHLLLTQYETSQLYLFTKRSGRPGSLVGQSVSGLGVPNKSYSSLTSQVAASLICEDIMYGGSLNRPQLYFGRSLPRRP